MKSFHLTVGGKRYAVRAERDAAEPDKLHIELDGVAHVVQVEEEEKAKPRSASAGARRPAPRPVARPAAGGGKVLSPLPGVVLAVEVSEGDEVQPGQRIVVLEAMKMENAISAEWGGTVRSVLVHKGQKVDGGQELMVIS